MSAVCVTFRWTFTVRFLKKIINPRIVSLGFLCPCLGQKVMGYRVLPCFQYNKVKEHFKTPRIVTLGCLWTSHNLFLGFTWRHKLCLSQCPPCWCPSGVKFMLIIVYLYSDASLLALIISPTTGISRNKKVDKKPGIHLKVSQCSLGMLKA